MTLKEVELFDEWRTYFMGPFPFSYNDQYVLVAVDYVLKLVEAIATLNNYARVVANFLKNNIFSYFNTPTTIISDGGKHFYNRLLESVLPKYWVKHRLATPYHPQISGQVEVPSRKMKQMFELMVNNLRTNWSKVQCGLHTKHQQACNHIDWCLAKLVTIQ